MIKRHPLNELAPDRVRIAPSILAADFSRLGDDIRAAEDAGADLIHVDIMDGHFVPNISIGPSVVQAIRPVTQLPLDVHLMLTDPGRYIRPFLEAGADNITIHVESEGDLGELLAQVHAAGASAGMTMRPGTPAAALSPYMAAVDLILVMTVEPGFGGQSFMREQLPKMVALRTMITASGRPIHLEVDGGINRHTAQEAIAAGARMLVAGSSVFGDSEGMAAAMEALRGAEITGVKRVP